MTPTSLLKKKLDALYVEMNTANGITLDPVEFPHRYRYHTDIEVAALIASSFAYGNIKIFKPVLESLFVVMGNSPADFCASIKTSGKYALLRDFRYRFNSPDDISNFLFLIGKALRKNGSLKILMYSNLQENSGDIKIALEGFVDFFLNNSSPAKKTSGFCQLIPSPKKGGACKRLNLFLRWMVRKDATDLGIWNKISPSQLVIPLDTHILRISLRLGLTTRKTATWKTAREITDALKELDPLDPVKYDFALCHFGVSGKCPSSPDLPFCTTCSFHSICKNSNFSK